ncbi:hypothetical protein QYE76_059731 [Lolium multiflorum]|uniref:Uncharacterized protein n=1 Tax=Lolium multiflorum TaxID=4521 RepID=A0AAD8W359_LOLMU|nr:hypothetical protein QYE76_059731 [Lolium multiflorum]
MEAESQASFRGGDYRQITLDARQAAVLSAMDHGKNFVDLAGPSEPLTPKKEEDDWSFDFSDDDSGGDGNDAENLDYNTFKGRR